MSLRLNRTFQIQTAQSIERVGFVPTEWNRNESSEHANQFEFALLFVGHYVDEGLVEYSSCGQLGDDLEGLRAAWGWNIHLLSEPDNAVLQGIQGVVGSNPHLREKERCGGRQKERRGKRD